MDESPSDPGLRSVIRSLMNLEQRIRRLEEHLHLEKPESTTLGDQSHTPNSVPAGAGAGLELRIGEVGLAWAGSIIFLLGIFFLMTYLLNQGYGLFSAAMGYCASLGLYAIARSWQSSYISLSRILVSASLLLLFYTTIRLHYFTVFPMISGRSVALILLLIVVASEFSFTLVIRSQALAVLTALMGIGAGLLSDAQHILFPVTTVFAAAAVFFALRRGWWVFFNATIIFAYLAHLLWLMNNPLVRHEITAVVPDQYSLAYAFLSACLFVFPILFDVERSSTQEAQAVAVFLNCLGFSAIAFFATLTLYPASNATVAFAVCCLFLISSAGLWLKAHHQFAATVYASFGYLALSIAIYGYTKTPEAFLWLALQSFLVVSMALWFRSRTLVVVNAIVFIAILVTYLTTSTQADIVNFGFSLVALGSARVMNWKKSV